MDVIKAVTFQMAGAIRCAAAQEDARGHRASQDAGFCADIVADSGAMRCDEMEHRR